MAATNYAKKANDHARIAEQKVEQSERFNGVVPTVDNHHAQVHATLAVAYATLAVYTSTGNG